MPFKKTICLVIKFFVNEIKLLKINIVYFFVIFKEFKNDLPSFGKIYS